MIKGQVLDINSQYKTIDKNQLEEINLNKTAALIRASIETGIILSKNDNNKLNFFSRLADKIGLAFQIKDDILDGDKEKNRQTYFSTCGKEKTYELYDNLSSEIYSYLDKLDGYDFFRYLVGVIISRKY